MRRPKEELKQASCYMEFPIHMPPDHIRLYCNEVAKKMATAVEKELREKAGPNWFDCPDGFIHQPGVYK